MSTVTAPPATPQLGVEREPRVLPATAMGYALLALLAYLPPLLSHRGEVAADTKQYLYLDPGRLMSRAVDMWDPNIGMGTVTHQTIGYLFPMGPYYWTMERLGVPDWVAQRLWLGSLLFFAAAGVLYLFRTFGVRGPGVVVAAIAFMLTPYTLDYSARISVLLLPWAALPWLIGLVRKALADGGWRYPAIFALVVQVIGGVNATALVFAGVAPVLWIVYAWGIARDVTFRRALAVTAKIGALTVITSMWWLAGLSMQGRYGLNILRFTETVRAVARTSTPNEVLRGLGYWFFYGQDRLGPWIEAARNYTQQPIVILAGYGLATLSVLAFATTRWRHRAFFALLLLTGVVIAVGPHPYDDPTPLGALFKAFATNSTAGLALRSTGRAAPLVVLSLAVFLGLGINAAMRASARWGRPVLGLAAIGLAVMLIVVNSPALFDGSFYGKNLERPEAIPAYWKEAAAYLDAQPHTTRVLELPGSDFASYRWGNTVDPITPGLIDRPYVARELIPYGSPASADLFNALDRRIQERIFDPRGFAALASRMSVGTVVLRNDLQWERYDLISPEELQRAFDNVPGLSPPKSFGPRGEFTLAKSYISEYMLGGPANEPWPYAVVAYGLDDPLPIVRAESARRMLVVAGDGEGLVDAADLGLLDGAGAVVYSASYPDDPSLRRAVRDDATLVVTDNNRRRGRKWSTVRDNLGFTEEPGEEPLDPDPGDSRLDVFPDARASAFTVMEQRGVEQLRASSYGNTITYTPENRVSQAFDGDLDTTWRASAFGQGIGERIRLDLERPVTTDHVEVIQPLNGPRDRYITRVELSFDGGPKRSYVLGPPSRTSAGQMLDFDRQTFSRLELRIADTNYGRRPFVGGANAIGFAEIRLRDERARHDVRVDELLHMPTDLLSTLGRDSLEHPLVLVMNRQRGVPVPPRSDEELLLSRRFVLPTARTFALTGTARLTSAAQHRDIDEVLGLPSRAEGGISTDAKEFLAGCARCRADAAIDGDPTTSWKTPFVGVRNQWADYDLPRPVTFDHMDLQIVADGRHSVPRELTLQVDGKSQRIEIPEIEDRAVEDATVPVRVRFPQMTGHRIRVTIEDVREEEAFSFFAAARVLLPAAIAEWGIPGVQLPDAPARLPDRCRDDLLTIDGRPVGVRITGATKTAEWLGPLSVELCDPDRPDRPATVRLGAGPHEVRTADGRHTALNLDRIALASAAGGDALAARGGRVVGLPGDRPPAPRVELRSNGRTEMKVRVTGATEPFWLVLGESRNSGWKADVRRGDAELGPAQLVDGYANGWLVRPGDDETFDVTLAWTPQRQVDAALVVSLLAALTCIAVVASTWGRGRRLRTVALGDSDVELVSPAEPLGGVPSRRARVVGTLVAGGLAAVVIAPWAGLVLAGLLLLVLWQPSLRALLGFTAAVLLGIAGLYVAIQQIGHHYPPVFEWPTAFPRARPMAWFAVALVAADALVEILRGGTRPHGARDGRGDVADDGAGDGEPEP